MHYEGEGGTWRYMHNYHRNLVINLILTRNVHIFVTSLNFVVIEGTQFNHRRKWQAKNLFPYPWDQNTRVHSPRLLPQISAFYLPFPIPKPFLRRPFKHGLRIFFVTLFNAPFLPFKHIIHQNLQKSTVVSLAPR